MSELGRGDSASRPARQSHAIRRQVIELRVSDVAEAHRLHAQVGSLIQDRIAPILEKCFSAASDPARVNRIERLELDLGILHPARLAEDMAAKVEAALPTALRRAKWAEVEAGPAAMGAHDSALLLISQFARTGGLPWWSDARKLNAVEDAIEAAHRAAPKALAALLRSLAADRRAVERLVRRQSDAGLERLLSLLAPSAVTLPSQLGPLLAEVTAVAGVGTSELRHLLWRETLIVASHDETTDNGTLLETVLTNLALAAGTTLVTLLADLRAASLARDHAQRNASDVRVAGLAAPGAPRLAAKAAAEQVELAPLLDRLASRAHALGSDQLRPLRPLTRPGLLAMAPQQQSREAPERSAPITLAEATEDEAVRYVENAGLCLLWPFLGRFFARLGLLTAEETAFASDGARCRAVGLLHHLATGERDPPEFCLALNKVLCGLDLDALAVFGPPVTDGEADESERLLAAAIAHAACLGAISTNGFRGSFLLRRGALATRDGAWLLRVERQAADMLLDRFPWKTEWIRLPWMQAALRVEW